MVTFSSCAISESVSILTQYSPGLTRRLLKTLLISLTYATYLSFRYTAAYLSEHRTRSSPNGPVGGANGLRSPAIRFCLSVRQVLFVWRFLGLIIVPYLMTIEFAILKTICVYCTIMHGCILIDFAIVTYFLFYKDITHPEGEAVDDPGTGLEST